MSMPRHAMKRIIARCPNRWDRFYIPAKLRSDPVYGAVLSEVSGTSMPVLDIGCGIGLLTHYLRELGHAVPMTGFDYDERKIHSAAVMAEGMDEVRFSVGDARRDLPAHSGHVVILDILQFFRIEEQNALLREAAQRVAPGGKLVIRSGINEDSWRHQVTIFGDWLAKATKWMRSGPVAYPTREQFTHVLSDCGLNVRIDPMWGGTPFNNHLVVGMRG